MATGTKILKYALLPEVLPRAWRLFASGFAHLSVFMAILYKAVGLLPPGHAYLDPRNAGRFGVRHVIAEAANNITFDKKHIDQVVIFFIILGGAALLFAQFILLFIALAASHSAFALPIGPGTINYSLQGILGLNAKPEQDLAFIILDRVFGMTGNPPMFNSCVAQNIACADLRGNPLPGGGVYPTPFHIALHTLLRFYSLGIFLVSVILIIYFVITITAETAATGVPFGQRFNKAWAPVRLILFAALLIPLNIGGTNAGLNAGQLITLWTAKFGSNFATNAWNRFNAVLTTTYLGDTVNLVGAPNAPDLNALAQFMFTVKACQIAENYAYGYGPQGLQAYVVRPFSSTHRIPGPDFADFSTTSFATARDFSDWGTIHIRFGEQHKKHDSYNGTVRPYCGEMQIRVTKVDAIGGSVSGATGIQALYYDMIKKMWEDATMRDYALCLRDQAMQENHDPNCVNWPGLPFQETIVTRYQTFIENKLAPMIAQQKANGQWNVPQQLKDKGWAGAAIWYNRIAEMNGDVANAVATVPQPETWPYMMEVVARTQRMTNENVGAGNIFDPEAARSGKIDYPRGRGKDNIIAAIENTAWGVWNETQQARAHFAKSGQGIVIDTINALFGTSGVFAMRENTNIHPLAQLSAIGKGMMDAAIVNFTLGTSLTLGGNLGEETFGPLAGKAMAAAANFLTTISRATMAMSFVLYYVIPFMPFIYFFFAVMGWIKAIFEAVVGMPLWALAHLRIDGEGMAGPAASNGYFLLLEIFLRPVLIVFGLLAGIQIFSALVVVLHDVFDLVVQNVGGFDQGAELMNVGPSKLSFKRSGVDSFFYTIVYVAMCYMMGLGCFKLIDEIPNSILRWMNVSVSALVEQADEAGTQALTQSYEGATLATQTLQGGQLAALLAK